MTFKIHDYEVEVNGSLEISVDETAKKIKIKFPLTNYYPHTPYYPNVSGSISTTAKPDDPWRIVDPWYWDKLGKSTVPTNF